MVRNTAIRGIDVENAYLQVKYTHDVCHFLDFEECVREAMPEEWKKKMECMRKPVHKMVQSMYGHPIAGKLFVEQLLDTLQYLGWKPCDADPAVMVRGEGKKQAAIAVYVDDVMAEGEVEILDALWKELSRFFAFSPAAEVDVMLGMRMKKYVLNDVIVMEISIVDYVILIIKTYEAEKGEVRKSLVPSNADVRVENRADFSAAGDLKFLQGIVGMLLWATRCGRADICFHVCSLSGRMMSWSPLCERQLALLIGYLKATKFDVMKMQIHVDEARDSLEAWVHTDSDWTLPKSRHGHFAFIKGSSEKTILPLDWSSKNQTICADSTQAAECIGMHYGIRESLLGAEAVLGDGAVLIAGGDNNAAIRAITRGSAGNLRAFQRVVGLKVQMVKDIIDAGMVRVEKVKSKECRADVFTKVVARLLFEEEKKMLMIEKSTMEEGRVATDALTELDPARPTMQPGDEGECVKLANSASSGRIYDRQFCLLSTMRKVDDERLMDWSK